MLGGHRRATRVSEELPLAEPSPWGAPTSAGGHSMQSRVPRRATALALSLTLVAVGMLIAPAVTLAAPVSTTVHRQIGFEASVPFDESDSDSEEVCAPFCIDVASYEVRAIGTAHIRVALGV